MGKVVVALIVGILLGMASSRFYGMTPVESLEADAADATEAVAALPPLPQPYYDVLFENEAVRIVDHTLEPGGSEPEHTHPPMVAYFVQGATLVITEADGSTSELTIPTGAFLGADDLRWWTHALDNTGDTPLHSILVEFKDVPAGG